MTISPSPLSPRTRRLIMAIDRVIVFITRHWLALAIIFLTIFAGLPFLAPVLMHYGITAPAELIYKGYGVTCHQLSFRTYFFFGAQATYRINELQSALGVNNPASDAFFWRDFIGNPQVGYKMAWCQREVSIYGAMIVAFILFGLLRPRVQPLDWRIYLLFVLPMAIDGAWQLFTSPVYLLQFLPVHESTPDLRLITGALFGFGSVWLVFPHVDQAMREAARDAQRQFERAKARAAQDS